MATAAFGSKIELAKKRVTAFADNLAIKYIPYSVRAVCAEFPSFFDKTKYVYFTTTRTYKDGYSGYENYIGAKISFNVPKGSEYIKVITPTEYNELKKLDMSVKAIENAQAEFKQRVQSALIALKTENKVKESLPEALPYIEFPEEVQLPAPIFDTLRNIIKNIKNDGNEQQEK